MIHDDEYDALARQLHESITDGQTIAETAKALRIVLEATPNDGPTFAEMMLTAHYKHTDDCRIGNEAMGDACTCHYYEDLAIIRATLASPKGDGLDDALRAALEAVISLDHPAILRGSIDHGSGRFPCECVPHQQARAALASPKGDGLDAAGHRIEGEHDCFLMNCKALGPEVNRLRERIALLDKGDGLDVERLATIVSDSLAAATMGTDYAEAPEPSDEPGSPYVMRLTNEIASRLASSDAP